ncbi:MAG: hypothetical protein HC903_29550 [Methylacidiphilales bacterium]|nr:hypothetical protein [Candidatus Methylacidiphilales bacterium]
MAEQRCGARILSGVATTIQNPRFSKRGEFKEDRLPVCDRLAVSEG